MKVLFVASGNKSHGKFNAFVQAQFDSLQKEGLDMLAYPVVGRGWKGYLRNFGTLRRLILKEKPGYLAALAAMGQKLKKVVSILGSFPEENRKLKFVRFCVDHVWHVTLVKSERTRAQLDRDLPVIPNGVNLEMFPLTAQDEAKERVGFGKDGKYVIFVSNPARPEKQFGLAEEAVRLLHDDSVHLVPVFDKPHSEIVDYMCAADALIMTSANEGSPNVIKEAMACNCPIVVTDVGDVRWVTEGVDGTYVSDTFEPEEIAGLLKKALGFGARTRGRERIVDLGLTSGLVAQKLIRIYTA